VSTDRKSDKFLNALASVWRQVLVLDAPEVTLGAARYFVRRTPRSKLRQVDFTFDGQALRGLEQNQRTNSRWAALARKGSRVMQFLRDGRYIASVVDGKVQLYGSNKP
jgi:hypothetical protein